MKKWNRLLKAQLRALSLALLLAILPVAAGSAEAQAYSVLYSFGGLAGDFPTGLLRDAAGNLYGTTQYGGFYGWGTVFKLDTTGGLSVLYAFKGQADGGNPEAGLVRDAAGNLYGTTYQGGNLSGCGQVATGCGVVFKVDTAGREAVLHTFTGGADGGNPFAGLALDAAGNLYGTTAYGGAYGGGTVFKVDTTGTETVLYNFTGATDGGTPEAGLVLDATGNLYGTTEHGGTFDSGTVFEVDANGTETVLHSFSGPPDGAYPVAGLIVDAAGDFYGTTFQGGDASGCSSAGCGVVFKLDSSNKETVLYSFTGGADGANPEAGVVLDVAGNLYGTTLEGGDTSACFLASCGVVFKLDPAGKETVLHAFGTGQNDGTNPFAGLILDASGNIYGTTQYGVYHGAGRLGTAFKITPLPGFLLSASALAPSTVIPGASSTSTVNVTAIGGFDGSVTLACSVQPAPLSAPECSITPSSIVAGKTAQLTVTTTGSAAGTMSSNASAGPLFSIWLGLIGLALAGAYLSPEQRRAGSFPAALLTCILFVGLAFQAGCSSASSSSGTPIGPYTITVTAKTQSSGITPQTTQLTLTVQ